MTRKRKHKKITYPNNIWDKKEFKLSCFGGKIKIVGLVKYFIRCIKWSKQRIVRGYAQCDRWGMYHYLQNLIPDMLQDLKDNRMGSPGHLGENYINEEGVMVNDTCHKEWDDILDQMIFWWKEMNEDTCSRKNPYEEEYERANEEFDEKYGMRGEKLRTKEEIEESEKSGYRRIHTMDEVPEYKEIYEKYFEAEKERDRYMEECKDKAMDMLKEYFFCLWD